jgi:dienelactone hydrolase
MTMFKYFPDSYVWNLSVNIALEMGARIGEIEAMCAPLLNSPSQGTDAGTREFQAAWVRMADTLCALAEEDQQRHRLLSAGNKLNRAATYLLVAERMQAHGTPGRRALYERFLQTFQAGCRLSRENCERVEIPYEGGHLAGLYVRAEGVDGPAPILVQVNGLDSIKEMMFRMELPQILAQRGISSLVVDQPGTGEAIRLHGLTAVHDAERWASPIVDWLEQRDDVDARRIGLLGVSLGGYYAPRAMAFEPRFALGVVWGANHQWGELQKVRLAREGARPVPHYWEHVQWVWGADSVDAFMAKARSVTLDGLLDRIRVPFLVTHGESDRQIPLDDAYRTFEQLTASPDKELKIFTAAEGGAAHCQNDNRLLAHEYIGDWLADRLLPR